MQRLLVSVRGPREAIAAVKGGAHIADVEYPGSALGTPYPLNVRAVREGLDEAGFDRIPISTNIGKLPNPALEPTAFEASALFEASGRRGSARIR